MLVGKENTDLGGRPAGQEEGKGRGVLTPDCWRRRRQRAGRVPGWAGAPHSIVGFTDPDDGGRGEGRDLGGYPRQGQKQRLVWGTEA